MENLKCRGWINSTKQFVYNPTVNLEKKIFDTGIRECNSNSKSIGVVMEHIKYIQLSTGLSDKNGKKYMTAI